MPQTLWCSDVAHVTFEVAEACVSHRIGSAVASDLLISGFRVEGSDRRNSGSRQLVVQKMGFATVDR